MTTRRPLYLDTSGRPREFAAGDTLPAAQSQLTLLVNVPVAQSGLVLAGGIREVTVACTGTVVGQPYLAFSRSFQLSGGALTLGKPAGYSIIDASCNVAGQIVVSLNAPALTLLTSYVINCDIVKVTAA